MDLMLNKALSMIIIDFCMDCLILIDLSMDTSDQT